MSQPSIHLPAPAIADGMPLAQALAQRRSVRNFGAGGLTLAQAGQLLWAAQGTTSRDGLRTAPSAGALYPLEIHLVAGAVAALDGGIYHYEPRHHVLTPVRGGDARAALAAAALDQPWVRNAAVVLACSGVYARTGVKYGRRGERYVHLEAGHAAQNVFLQATGLGLHTVVVGAFDDDAVRAALHLPADRAPLWLMPVGR